MTKASRPAGAAGLGSMPAGACLMDVQPLPNTDRLTCPAAGLTWDHGNCAGYRVEATLPCPVKRLLSPKPQAQLLFCMRSLP